MFPASVWLTLRLIQSKHAFLKQMEQLVKWQTSPTECMDWRVEGGADAVVGLLRKLLADHTLFVDSVEIVAI